MDQATTSLGEPLQPLGPATPHAQAAPAPHCPSDCLRWRGKPEDGASVHSSGWLLSRAASLGPPPTPRQLPALQPSADAACDSPRPPLAPCLLPVAGQRLSACSSSSQPQEGAAPQGEGLTGRQARTAIGGAASGRSWRFPKRQVWAVLLLLWAAASCFALRASPSPGAGSVGAGRVLMVAAGGSGGEQAAAPGWVSSCQ